MTRIAESPPKRTLKAYIRSTFLFLLKRTNIMLAMLVLNSLSSFVAISFFHNLNHTQVKQVSRENPKQCLPASMPKPLQSSIKFCQDLIWVEPKLCSGGAVCLPQPDADEDIQSFKNNRNQMKNEFRLFVHYVYHESGSESLAEKQNKRVNLEIFLQEAVINAPSSVEFHFTNTGYLPQADEYFKSLGTSEGLHRDQIFPTDKHNLHLRSGEPSSTDLCQHGRWLSTANVTTGPANFVLFLNDGVRGPFVTELYKEKAYNEPSINNSGVPRWFLPFLAKFNNNQDLTMVGPTLSTEITAHVQSYAISLRLVSPTFLMSIAQHLVDTCNMTKLEAIQEGEIGLSVSILKRGFSIGSFFPNTNNISVWHEMCRSMKSWAKSHILACAKMEENEVSSKLSTYSLDVQSRILAFGGANPTFFFEGPASSVVFAKYGGEVLRENLIPVELHRDVLAFTRKVLGNHTWEPLSNAGRNTV